MKARTGGSVLKAGVIAVIPSDALGATVTCSNLEVNSTTGSKTTSFQNYRRKVSVDDVRISNGATKTVLCTYEPTTISDVSLDGVKIR